VVNLARRFANLSALTRPHALSLAPRDGRALLAGAARAGSQPLTPPGVSPAVEAVEAAVSLALEERLTAMRCTNCRNNSPPLDI
jgi:hypothetical protein